MDPHDTRGRALLGAWLDADGRSQAALARELGIAATSVNAWVAGRSRPEPHLRKALEILASVPEDAWHTDEERSVVERVRAAAVGAP